MKKIKPNTIRALMFAALMATAACNNPGSNSTSATTDSVMAKVDTAAQKIKQDAQNVATDVKQAIVGNVDSNFAVKASLANMEELRLLQAGLDNGTSKELKTYAKMMMADHKKLGDKVNAWAAKAGYPLPGNDKSDNAMTELGSTRGADWDKAWTDKLISGHEDAITLFENNENAVKDADLKALITDALPTLHMHLDMLKKLKDKLNN